MTDLGGNSGSMASPQAPAGLGPSGYDPGREGRVRLDAKWLRQEITTAFWVFLSPLSGFWWAFGRCYPLFKDRGLTLFGTGDENWVTYPFSEDATYSVEVVEVTTVSRAGQ